MNKTKADNVLDIVKINFDKRKNLVDEVLKVDEITNSYQTGRFSLESTNAILADMDRLMNERDFDVKFYNYLVVNNISNDNIKQIAKLKSVDDLKLKVEKCFDNPKSYFNSYVYKVFLELSNSIEKDAKMEATPLAILDRLNAKRKILGLMPVVENAKTTLNTLNIDEDKLCVTTDENVDEKFKNLLHICSANNITVYDNTKNDSNIKGFVYLPQTSNKQLKYVNFIYGVASNLQATDYEKLVAENKENTKTIDSVVKTDNLDTKLVADNFNELLNLITTQNILLSQVRKDTYSQLSKVVEYNMCKNLKVLADNLNSEEVTKLLLLGATQNTANLYQKLDISVEKLQKAFGLSTTKYESFVLCPLVVDYDTKADYVGKIYTVDYANIGSNTYYLQVAKQYKDVFNNIISSTQFVKYKTLNLNQVESKIDNIYQNLQDLKAEIEKHNSLTTAQYKTLVHAYAFCDVASVLVRQISTNIFAHEISAPAKKHYESPVLIQKKKPYEAPTIKKQYVAPSLEVTEIEMENNFITKFDGITLDEEVESNSVNEPTTEQTVAEVAENVDKHINATVFDHESDANNFMSNVKNASSEDDVFAVSSDENKVQTETAVEEPAQEIETEEQTEQDSIEVETDEPATNQVDEPAIENVEKKQYTSPEISVKKKSYQKPQIDEDAVRKILEEKRNRELKQREQLKMEERQKQLMEEKFNQLSNSYNELNAKLERLTALYNQKSAKEIDQEKLAEMQARVSAITNASVKKAVSSLANKNVDELSKKLLYTSKEQNSSYSMLITSLNMLFNMESGDKTVRNMFISMNKAETAKQLMLLKHSLENVMNKVLTKYIAVNAMQFDGQNLSDHELITKTLSKLNSKMVDALEDSRLAEIDMLKFEYLEDSFEYQDALDEINARYLGDDEHIGLMQQLKQNLYVSMLKQVILKEVQRIDYCNNHNQKYTFDEKHAELILTELFNTAKEETETMTF